MPLNSKSNLRLVDLDFDNLKNSFKNYLKQNEAFRDYDLDGSNFSVLLEILARNTFHNAFYTNMAISEGFLDSAQLRNSILSHAKELNYLPRSKRSARATVRISFEATSENQPYVIPKGSQLSTMIKSDSYVFTIPETISVASTNTSFQFVTDIFEGIYLKDSYVYLDGVVNQRFKITNKNVDTSSINVVVIEDEEEIGTTFKLSNTLLDLNHSSKVFFIQSSETGYYEVYFGDGVLGYEPKKHSRIIIDYRISNGLNGNGAKSFSVDFDPTARAELLSTPLVEVIEVAANGAEEEHNESVRYYAPKHFQVQNRAVIDTDYEIMLKNEFSEINAISVYGGEEADIPELGKVFISLDLKNIEGLPDSRVEEYKSFIQRRSPYGIIPVFVKPEYTYIHINSFVRYNLNLTTNSANRIKTLILNEILNFNDVELNDFNVTLRDSNLVSLIDDADRSIISNITDVMIYKKLINPSTTSLNDYNIEFGMPLSKKGPYTITSSPFTFAGEIVKLYDLNGEIFIAKPLTNGDRQNIRHAGYINYETGTINLTNFVLHKYDGPGIKIFAYPRDKDISSLKNNIILIEPDEIFVEVEGINE